MSSNGRTLVPVDDEEEVHPDEEATSPGIETPESRITVAEMFFTIRQLRADILSLAEAVKPVGRLVPAVKWLSISVACMTLVVIALIVTLGING